MTQCGEEAGVCQEPPFILHLLPLRKARRLSRARLAAASGLAAKRIQRLENHQCVPRLTDLISLAETFGVAVEQLYEIRPCHTTPQEKRA
jgi:transcriptional regulator with XRE-family HTH domain